MRLTKISSILPLFYPLPIFYPLTFHLLNQTNLKRLMIQSPINAHNSHMGKISNFFPTCSSDRLWHSHLYRSATNITFISLAKKKTPTFIYPFNKLLRTSSPHNHILQRPTRLKIQDVGTESYNENEWA